MSKKQILAAIICACFIAALPGTGAAGDFTVEPFRLEMGPRQKSGVFTLTNVGSGPLNFQVRLSEWTQDREGKDVYTGTSDIVFYPKILSLQAGERQIIRVGASRPIVASEKTYRLFIDEMPSPQTTGKQQGAQVSVRISFAPPIFVRPSKELEQGSIEKTTLEKGSVRVFMRNTGNVHLKINTVAVKAADSGGNEVFSKTVEGWYLLNGGSRVFAVQIPDAVCPSVASVSVIADAGRLVLRDERAIGADPGKCSMR